MTDTNSRKSHDESRVKKGREITKRESEKKNLSVDASSMDFFTQALEGLSEEEMRDVRKLVIEEKVKLESHKHKMAIDE